MPTAQSLDTLREGYSWIRALESRYPGWSLASVDGFPFTLPVRPLAESKVCLVSLAGVHRKGQKHFGTHPVAVPRALKTMGFKERGDWSMRIIPGEVDPEELAVAHNHYDHSDANEDINCVFPVARLRELALDGFVGECAEQHYSLMGYVPEVDPIVRTAVQELVPLLRREAVDCALISGGCALSHQSAGLVQREIEAAGIPTVAVSVCADITYLLQVPRAAALRFPLGNPFGSSWDAATQTRVLRDALALLDTVQTPGEIMHLPYDWTKT
ncbi:MAG: hypothetical protein FJW35_00310 [Acidobacteria bacterium]|nr:hypothetical protein [Acidobacteriota bacterium]